MARLTGDLAYALAMGYHPGGRTGWLTAKGEPVDIRAEPEYERFATAHDGPGLTPDQPPQDDRR